MLFSLHPVNFPPWDFLFYPEVPSLFQVVRHILVCKHSVKLYMQLKYKIIVSSYRFLNYMTINSICTPPTKVLNQIRIHINRRLFYWEEIVLYAK